MNSTRSGVIALAILAACGAACAQSGGTGTGSGTGSATGAPGAPPGSMGSTDGTHGDGSTANSQTTGTVHRTKGTHSHIKYPKHHHRPRTTHPATPASGTGDASGATTQ